MFGKKTQEPSDLTTRESVERGQKVYDRAASGKCKDVKAELDDTYGRKSK